MYEDDQGLLWLGTMHGISQYNWTIDQFETIRIFDGEMTGTTGEDMYIDPNNIAWFPASKEGLKLYDIENKKVSSFSNNHPNTLLDNTVKSITSPDDKRLFVNTKKGLQ